MNYLSVSMDRTFLTLLVGYFMGFFGSINSVDFSTRIQSCRTVENKSLNECVFLLMQDMKPYFQTGIPELNTPVLDPMTIAYIDFFDTAPMVEINARFFQVVVRGVSNFQPTRVNAIPRQKKVYLDLKIPELRINGLYDLSGSVLLLPVKGNGTFWAILSGIDATADSDLFHDIPNNRLYITRTIINFNIRHIRVRLNNLFGGDVVGETINQVINDNSKEILESIKPKISEKMSEVIIKVLNDSFSKIPADAFMRE